MKQRITALDELRTNYMKQRKAQVGDIVLSLRTNNQYVIVGEIPHYYLLNDLDDVCFFREKAKINCSPSFYPVIKEIQNNDMKQNPKK